MKRLLLVPVCLFLFMLGTNPAPAEENAQKPEGHVKTGMLYYEQGQNEVYADQRKLDEAATEFAEALLLDPNSAKARYYLGLTCLAMDSKGCAEKQYQLLKDLDAGMAEILHTKILEYKSPARFEHIKTIGKAWKPPKEEKTSSEKSPASEAPSPEASATPESGKGCEIVSFSTHTEPGRMGQLAGGGTIYEEQQQCVTATIRNTGAARAWAANYTIVAHFSDGDTMQERITDGITAMNAVEPGGTVTGTACFKKEKATITVVECGMW